ncbi:hypothetical protein ACQ4M3_02425 [Leptolyngbya sp. AN03gr2]|uniref:hypothetical protein n=1 Tax=unclassified Leptolyngbya TaxID=2650499 RepID=UPI003D31DD02
MNKSHPSVNSQRTRCIVCSGTWCSINSSSCAERCEVTEFRDREFAKSVRVDSHSN